MRIVANCIVYNEENFVWFAVMSIVDYVDKVLIYDTGSTDNTARIIEEIIKRKGNKILFKKIGRVDKFEFTKIRQEMLNESSSDWILILDGDEVWPKDSIEKLIKAIKEKGKSLESIAVPFYNLVGDIYHYQNEKAGQYQLLGKKGHLTIRAISKSIPGLHVDKPYGQEGFFDQENHPIQERDAKKQLFLEAPYLHFTHLKRSSQRQAQNKYKHDLGHNFPEGFKFPEVLYSDRPEIISDPFYRRSIKYEIVAKAKDQLKRIIRR